MKEASPSVSSWPLLWAREPVKMSPLKNRAADSGFCGLFDINTRL